MRIKYIRTDKGASNRHQTEEKDQKKIKKSETLTESSQSTTNKEASFHRQSLRSNDYDSRYDSYNSLSALRAQILIKIEGEEYLCQPPPMKAPLRSHDKEKY